MSDDKKKPVHDDDEYGMRRLREVVNNEEGYLKYDQNGNPIKPKSKKSIKSLRAKYGKK